MRWLVVAVLLLVWSGAQAETLDLYFLRHAQTMANVTRTYTEENQQTFSRWGRDQVEAVPEKLAGIEFDVVIVSPAWRTQHTILPVLQERGIQAEIWPEIYECCWDRETEEDEPALVQGERIVIEEDLQDHFQFRDDESVYMYDVDTPARGELMVERAVDLVRTRFSGTDKTILLVSHYHTGARILTALLDEPPDRPIRPANARLTHLQQDPDGRFRLLRLNDQTVE